VNENNPYENPTVVAGSGMVRLPDERAIPDSITTPIRQGWIAAMVAVSVGVLLAAIILFTGNWLMVMLCSIDLVVIGLLGWGTKRRSRAAATALLLYTTLPKLALFLIGGFTLFNASLALLLAIFYFRAMTATYRYHRFVQQWRLNPPKPRPSLADNPLFATPAVREVHDAQPTTN